MKLITKVASLVVMLLVISLVLAVMGTVSMNKVGDRLTRISAADIPLLGSITNITFAQLEQSAWIERGLVSAGANDWDSFGQADTKIASLEKQVLSEFSSGYKTLNKYIDDESNIDREKYSRLIDRLSEIESEYVEFVTGSREMLGLILNQEISHTDVDLVTVRKKVKNMSSALLALTAEISVSTTTMTTAANGEKQGAIDMMILVSVLAIIIALILSGWLIHGINKQLGGDPADLVGIAEAMASGDLNIRRKVISNGVYGSINKTMDKLIDIISGIKAGAIQVHEAAEQVSQGNANLSQRTQEQASSLEEVASSMEEMTGTINQNAENAQLTNKLTQEARTNAENGVEVAVRAIGAMNEIETSSKKIAAIISVIDEIAFQTNLLALNAAVEAARAGEQGRGFAVVASEVRNLAGRSATAAKEIKDLIHDSVLKVEDGTKLVDETGGALSGIVSSVKKASVMATEIAAASKEQSEGIEQVNKALLQMDDMTQQNASLVEEAAAASEAVGAQAQELNDLVAFFNVGKGETAIALNDSDVQRLESKNVKDEKVTEEKPNPKLSHTGSKSQVDDGEWEDF